MTAAAQLLGNGAMGPLGSLMKESKPRQGRRGQSPPLHPHLSTSAPRPGQSLPKQRQAKADRP